MSNAFENKVKLNALTVSVKDFGAVGDNTTNDAAAVQAAIDYVASIGGGVVSFESGKTYRLVTAPIVKTNVKLNLNGATINLKFAAGSDVFGFDMRDYSAIFNGTINVVEDGAPTGADKAFHCAVLVGLSGASLAGFTGVRISDLVITTNRSGLIGGRGVLVQSASNNIIIENLRFPDSANLGTAVQISWAGPGGNPPATSQHPYNITVRNISIGAITKTGTSFDIAAIDLVGCYNISVENVYVDRWAGDAVVQVRPGGFGDTVAPASVKPLLFKNIIIRNISAKSVDQHCVIVNGRANDAAGAPANSIPAIFQNIKAVGTGLVSTSAGIRVLHAFDTIIENCEIEQFDRGVFIEERAKRIKINGGRYLRNNESGVLIASGAVNPEDIVVSNVESYLNGQDGTAKAGFELEACDKVQFINCTAGDATSETTQLYGFRVHNTASNTKFSGVNKVRNIKAGGTKYLFASAVYGDRQFCGGSNAALDTGANRFASISGVGLSTNESDVSINSGGTPLLLTNFRCKTTTAPGGVASFGFRVIDDGVATALEVAVVGAATTANDFDAVEVSPGSELSVQSLPSGTPASSRGKWSVEVILI